MCGDGESVTGGGWEVILPAGDLSLVQFLPTADMPCSDNALAGWCVEGKLQGLPLLKINNEVNLSVYAICGQGG
jgi:hypothetical protein